ncbi:MFS transporter [Nocardia bovistercoris]|uniref:MFS transporter n=1 Tax=Nocardia bovistercoris TaxID=2785916 RepID=A0A931IIC7_9NOCA|nr:MFS transporter [Nocardia bovistercoris]MBH0780153.1 MFS transporter [Nocardia bovistercoris]
MSGSARVDPELSEPFPLRRLTWTVFVPMAVYSTGYGAAAPMYVLRALDLGVSAAAAGIIVALTGLGMVLADLPAGSIVARIGERGAVAAGSLVGVVGVVAAACAPNIGMFAVGMVLIGVSGAVWGLARQSYLVAVVPRARRGRALSLMAGASRFGTFCGPFLGAGPVHAVGPNGALWLQLGATVVSAAAMMSIATPDGERADASERSMSVVIAENRRVLGTLGAAALVTGAARAARVTLLPLWAAHVGVGAATTSLIFGVAGAVDVVMSYPAGVWIDRYGRRATGVPAMVLFAVGYGLLPLTSTAVTVGAAAVVLGVANGLSNGLIMTVGADVAPVGKRAEFLGAWRLAHDLGYLFGPVAVGVVGAVALGGAAVVVAVVSVAGAEAMRRWFPGVPAGGDVVSRKL